jgi:hypothetical protein
MHKNNSFVFGMLALVLALGLVLAGCADKGIDGTWVWTDDDSVTLNSVKYIFDNGNFDFITPEWGNKGTYTVQGKNLTITVTSSQVGDNVIEYNAVHTGVINGDEITITRELRVGEFVKENFKKKPVVSGAKALAGTWEGPMGLTWSFTGNKFTQEMYGIKTTVPYKIKGNSISTEYEGAEVEMEFEIDGDTLTIEVMGYPMEFERVK